MDKLQLFIVLQFFAIGYSQLMTLESVRVWKKMDYAFPDEVTKANAVTTGAYVAENITPIDMDVDHSKSRLFVTTPRFRSGVPVTLGYVDLTSSESVNIIPYPDYEWQVSGFRCDRLTSVYRVAIDDCRRLWVLDAGTIGSERVCPPQIIAFNLDTDKVVKRYQFAQSLYTDKSLFVTPVIDLENGNCAKPKVYIADALGFGLIVYDPVANRSWRIQNKWFHPHVSSGTFPVPPFTATSKTFDLMSGVFGLAISHPPYKDANDFVVSETCNRQKRKSLYFHALSSAHEVVVPLSLLNNASIWNSNPNSQPGAFKMIGSRGVQTAAEAMDSNGNMWFVLLNPIALVCWDSSLPYSTDNIKVVVENNETLQFGSGIKIIKNKLGEEEIWIMTIKFQRISSGTMNYEENNFRIQKRSIRELLKGSTKCNGQQLTGGFIFPPEVTC